MRRHAKYLYVLFLVVILSFIFWGVGSVDKSNGPAAQPLAVVGTEKVEVEDYWRTYDRMTNTYRDVYKEKFDQQMREELKAKVLESMIDNRVLVVAARNAGYTVSDAEVQDSIMSDQTFARNGAFSKDVYLRTLEINRLSPKRFEESRRAELLANKLRRMVEDAVDLSPEEQTSLVAPDTDPKLKNAMLSSMLDMKRQSALKSYIEGLKGGIQITVNKDQIS